MIFWFSLSRFNSQGGLFLLAQNETDIASYLISVSGTNSMQGSLSRGRAVQARVQLAQAVNSAPVLLNWARYGNDILSTLSKELVTEFGRGYSVPNLSRLMNLVEYFPDREIVVALSRQLGWSHFVEIIPIKHQLQRDIYAEICRIEQWSVRDLRDKIGGMLYERTAMLRKSKELALQELATLKAKDQLSVDLVFRDPYLLDFLGLKDTYSEADLEAAILKEIERFMLELGAGFCFVVRQKRINVDGDDYHLDLLFYHRKLRRLVAVDLLCGGPNNTELCGVDCYVAFACFRLEYERINSI